MGQVERFWSKVDKTGECWIWTAALNVPNGYGRYAVTRTQLVQAHRFAYELLVGPIPDGLLLDHLCRNRQCVNPAHLEPVTNRENVERGIHGVLRPTTCPHGHPFDEGNTFVNVRGHRECRICRRASRRAAKIRRRKAA